MLLLTGCDTENVGGGPIFFSIVGVSPVGTIASGDSVTFKASVAGAAGPYNVMWNFGGGATPNTVTLAGETGGLTSTTVIVGPAGTYTGTVQAIDAINAALATISVSFTYTVLTDGGPDGLFINNITYNASAGTITVDVSDADAADTITVDVSTIPPGFRVTPLSIQLASNPGAATFNVAPTDILIGATGNIGFTATDNPGSGNDNSPESTILVAIAPFAAPSDILFAVPLSTSAATGTPVTVLVLTGVPANPFQYLVGCGLTIESDADYISAANNGGNASFNVGAVGGAQGAADGIWAAMKGGAGPGGGFLLAPDNFIQATDIGGGRERWDFNITPLQGPGDTPTTNNLTSASGALFNCQFTFSTPGTKTFGFEEVRGVKRTYYADDSTEYFWGNIANDGSVVPNSVVVN